jgi:hypothetical protein
MWLMTNELLNPCHFIHLVVKDVPLQNLVVLMIRISKFLIIMRFHVIINLRLMCKVRAISIESFYSTKCYKICFDGWMTCVKIL